MIRFCDDLEAVSRVAAECVAAEANRAVQERGRFTLALSGGSTPARTYELLAQLPFRELIPWEKSHIFWGDERCVPGTDRRSNAGMARRALLDQVPIPAEQIHPMECASSPKDSAREYQSLLFELFAGDLPCFDLILLGLGANGHTASLFPEEPVLDEQQRWVSEVYVAEEGLYRLTLTVPVINQAAVVIFLVSGSDKASVLREVLESTPDPHRIPACLIKPNMGRLMWLVDKEAASLLKKN
ncbi:6-phosphogluconolactonase [Pelotalea chapellei]|uniref:6-phosphogluconolactonase n=1 Tax=Pelotalea chapellei TaxID=44671 RepID=A0ABS5U6W4_9BACT|nr:6-phosphogluconolactonase [Pelotalea chapellei]MBT1071415.1 6-phosphogluconolactonase [Pelotalea chapellei]